MREQKITIIGAGLVGSLLAITLARRGFSVDVYESRPDMRKVSISAGRSINLALANRGIYPLEQMGLMKSVEKILIPMRGRLLHDLSGDLQFQAYGQRSHEVIYSISREKLNSLLMTEAEATGKVKIYFQQQCTRIDLEKSTIVFTDKVNNTESVVSYERVMAADGGGSIIRHAILAHYGEPENESLLDHGYKELTIPALANNEFAMEKEALHIWPRGEFMLIALPNIDGSFTVTLFLPNQGPSSFSELNSSDEISQFFSGQFPDAVPLIPSLTQDFITNPTGFLGTVRCQKWHYEDKVLLIGDAAHAIVPFHGQGMNCGFEDCSALDECLDAHSENDWGNVFSEFQSLRKPNSDAIADMALENYIEMRSSVRDKKFQLKKQIAFKLEQLFPEKFIPRYSMVMFHKMPYSQAQQKGIQQEAILERCSQHISDISELDLELAEILIQKN